MAISDQIRPDRKTEGIYQVIEVATDRQIKPQDRERLAVCDSNR